jgi:Tol biopolymer transport system component
MSAILKEEPPELSMVGRSIPPGVERIVRHCMEKSPEERFQSARDLAFNLEAITSDSGESLALTSAPRVRPRGLLVGTAGVVLAAAVGLVIGLFLGERTAEPPLPEYHRMTFQHGRIGSARFGPDGETVVYSAAWEGNPEQVFLKRPESPDALPLDLPPQVRFLGLSSTGELAVLLNRHWGHESVGHVGTLARVPMTGGTPREIAEQVERADWTPDGTDLAVVRSMGGLRRLEFPIGNTLYETTGGIGGLRFSPKGDLIAFLDHPLPDDDRGSVAVTDLTGEVKRLSIGWESVRGLAWSPSGNEIWFTAAETGFFRELHGVTLAGRQRLIEPAPGGLMLQDVSTSGHVLLARQDSRARMVALPPGESQERDLSWLEVSVAADLSEDGEHLLFDEGGVAVGSDYAVCLRKTDGSPPVRLGEGKALSLSPDGKWALSQIPTPNAPLTFLPIGPGEPRSLTIEGISVLGARWFPDGSRLLVAGVEEGRGPRLYVCSTEGEDLRPVTPEGSAGRWGNLGRVCISPDGRWVTGIGPDQLAWLYPVADGEPHPIVGVEVGELPVRWASDGSLFVARYRRASAHVFRLDVETGERTLWKELRPRDPAGVNVVWGLVMTPDGESYAYTYFQTLSELYVVEGLR